MKKVIKKQPIKLKESQLKQMIAKTIKESLEDGAEFYICSETDYDGGKVDYWIGDKFDAEECEQCSEGSAIGPFDSYKEAVDFAKENDIVIPATDFDHMNEAKINKNMKKNTIKLKESQLRGMIMETVKNVLNEVSP